MSHVATKWAFDQPAIHPDMKPGELCVLLALADCHNPAQGCFPSQQYIQKVTNISERSVRDHLVRLRERGLINWETARRDDHRDNNRYSLAFEDGYQPANSAGSPTGENAPDQPAESDGPTGKLLPVHTEAETVIGTVKGTVEREGARASRQEEAEAAEARAEAILRLRKLHPNGAYADPARVDAAFDRLTATERKRAEQVLPTWVDGMPKAQQAKSSLAQYLEGKLWEAIPETAWNKTAQKAEAKAGGLFAAFSREWWWVLLQRVETDPSRASTMFSLARQHGIGTTVRTEEIESFTEAAKRLVSVSVRSSGWAAWRAWFRDKRISSVGDPDKAEFVWLPSEWPPPKAPTSASREASEERFEV